MFVILDDEQRLTQRRAVLLTVTPTDRWLDDTQQWRSAVALPIGTRVQAVDQPLTKSAPHVGEEILIRSFPTRRVYAFIVTEIHLVRASALTAGELRDLGHDNRDSFNRSLSGALGDRLCWFIGIFPASANQIQH